MKKLFITLLITMVGFGLFAKPVSKETAKETALNFYKHYNPLRSEFIISEELTMEEQGITTVYIFKFEGGGFIMVSADDAATPILAYSETSNFDFNDMAPATKAWIDGYSKGVFAYRNKDNTEAVAEWNKILKNEFTRETRAVSPLVSTTWNQDGYYNDHCESAVATGTYTGCVATALAQVLRKWSYPTTGNGSHTYFEPNSGKKLTVNFGGTTYNWSSMGTTATTANSAISLISYHCGVATNMQYSTSASGTYQQDLPYALLNYFKYQPGVEYQYRDNFSETDWMDLIKYELDNGRPVLYGGSSSSGGHSFICDGYNTSNLFHFNWGWGGSGDCYSTLTDMNGYTDGNVIIVRARPLDTSLPIADFTANTTLIPAGGSVNFTSTSQNSPTSYAWSFQGGTPSTSTSQNPTNITYATPGRYTVSLTVTNASGNDKKVWAKLINVGGRESEWEPQTTNLPTYRHVTGIHIADANTVWAVVDDSYGVSNHTREFMKTTNGGTTWTTGTITFTDVEKYAVSNIHAFDANTAYACMYPLTAKGGMIAKTTNGGTSWTTLDPGYSTSWLNFVHFFDANNGVCMGDPTTSGKFLIKYTTNGGASWSASTVPTPITNETGLTNTFETKGDTIWFGTTMGRIFRSIDKGKTFTATATGFSSSGAAIFPTFKNHLVGLITATNSGNYLGMKKTTDGGSTWTDVTPTGAFVKTPNIAYMPGTNYWINGASYNSHGSSYSEDDGATWKSIDTGSVQYTKIKFLNATTGWAGSIAGINNPGIFKWKPGTIVSVNEPTKLDAISIYPVPATDFVNISGVTKKAIVSVTNLLGERVLVKEFNPSTGSIIRTDLSDLSEGIYLISIDTGDKITTKRISVIK